jgi:predicted choloylglycine hydrolase
VLSLYDPPPLFAGCSVLAHDGKLTRNYDFHPDRIEGTILRTPRALGVADCLWGLLDGINESGLGIALAFGGRRAHGRGFAVSLVVRYVLETCATVAEAVDTLKRVPVHAPYNLTVAGPSEAVTVFVGPDRAARVVRPAVATNHQEHVDWPEHAAFTRSVERREALLAGADLLGPELYAEDYDEGFGTLYTAEYELRARAVTYRWPGEEWPLSLDAFTPAARTVRLRGRAVGAGPR